MTAPQPQPPADWEPDNELGGSTFREESSEPVEPQPEERPATQ